MRSFMLTVAAVLISVAVFCQTTPQGSFQCHINAAQPLSEAAINNFISKISFENYRLLNKRATLSFDNGFEIVLLSAIEAQAKGLINNASTYQAAYIAQFRLPVFHMTPDGKVSAKYAIINSKYSIKNH